MELLEIYHRALFCSISIPTQKKGARTMSKKMVDVRDFNNFL